MAGHIEVVAERGQDDAYPEVDFSLDGRVISTVVRKGRFFDADTLERIGAPLEGQLQGIYGRLLYARILGV